MIQPLLSSAPRWEQSFQHMNYLEGGHRIFELYYPANRTLAEDRQGEQTSQSVHLDPAQVQKVVFLLT